ncbi:MAG: hotdog domain-containing protein [Nautiliaceae bacterium]
MELKTHKKYNKKFGEIVELKENFAKVKLKTTSDMAVDKEGLVHGGFTFSAADFCAMAAVNEPYVVLAKSSSTFLAPVKVGDVVEFEGKVIQQEGKKYKVEVKAKVRDKEVYKGEFTCVNLPKHILN